MNIGDYLNNLNKEKLDSFVDNTDSSIVVKKNVKKVLNGETNILSNDYLYFSVGGHASHSSMVRVGAHQFCKTY